MVTPTLILILRLTLPRTKMQSLTLTLTLYCPRYHGRCIVTGWNVGSPSSDVWFITIWKAIVLLSPPNEVSEGTMKRASVRVCVCVRVYVRANVCVSVTSGLKCWNLIHNCHFLEGFWFCLFYLIGLDACSKSMKNATSLSSLLADFDSVCFTW